MNLISKRRKWAIGSIAALIFLMVAGVSRGTAQTKQPNILVIMGDDIGMWNIGAYHRGLMAGKTIVIPGLTNKFIPWIVRISPRGVVTRVVRRMQERVS